MKISTIRSVQTVLGLFFLVSASAVYAQSYVPVGVTGLNIDAIAETAPSSITTTTQTLDLSNHVMYDSAFAGAVGLPGGIVSNGTIRNGSRTYQLYPFTGNNCLYIASGATGVLTLITPASFNDISLLSFATEGSSTLDINLGFTDGSTLACGSYNIYDWFFGTGAVYSGFGRCIRTSAAPYNAVNQPNGAPTDPSFFPIDIPLSCTFKKKKLSTISITQTTGNNAYVMAVSGVSYSFTLSSSVTAVTCNGSADGTASVTAAGTNIPYTYSWSPSGGTGAVAGNLQPGTYSCSVRDTSGCETIQTFTITQPPALTGAGFTQTATNNQNNGSALVSVTGGSAAYTYSWSPSGGNGDTAKALPPGSYTCTITDSHHCQTTVTVTVPDKDLLSSITVPNVFTPNGDGINDGFQVTWSRIDQFDAKIYDRWGVLLSELTTPGQSWDGRSLTGTAVSSGTYYYVIQATGADQKAYDLKGFLTLIR